VSRQCVDTWSPWQLLLPLWTRIHAIAAVATGAVDFATIAFAVSSSWLLGIAIVNLLPPKSQNFLAPAGHLSYAVCLAASADGFAASAVAMLPQPSMFLLH